MGDYARTSDSGCRGRRAIIGDCRLSNNSCKPDHRTAAACVQETFRMSALTEPYASDDAWSSRRNGSPSGRPRRSWFSRQTWLAEKLRAATKAAATEGCGPDSSRKLSASTTVYPVTPSRISTSPGPGLSIGGMLFYYYAQSGSSTELLGRILTRLGHEAQSQSGNCAVARGALGINRRLCGCRCVWTPIRRGVSQVLATTRFCAAHCDE